MNIKDYLHLYLGCQVIGTYNDASGSKGYLTGVTNGGYDCEIQFILEDGINVEEEPQYNEVKDVKPILRPLSDMTEDEVEFIGIELKAGTMNAEFIRTSKYCWTLVHTEPEVFRFLLSNHFDLFGLIDAGLAIDKTTLK